MKKKIYLTLTVIFAACLIYAQQITFRKNYRFADMDIPGNMIKTSAGEYIFCGFNMSFIPIYGNVTKINQHGNIIWSKGILGSIATALTDVIEISSALGGGYLVAGESSVKFQ